MRIFHMADLHIGKKLNQAGLELDQAHMLEQVIQRILAQKPDVLVLDLMLPKRDGISILKAVAAMEHGPVTLATSGFVTDYAASTAAGLGVRYLMLKPCDMSALVEHLEESATGLVRSFDGEIYPLKPEDILYMEAVERTLELCPETVFQLSYSKKALSGC